MTRDFSKGAAWIRGDIVPIAEATIGKNLEIHGTPRMYINGKLYRGGRSAEQIARQIEIELGAAPADAATPSPIWASSTFASIPRKLTLSVFGSAASGASSGVLSFIWYGPNTVRSARYSRSRMARR